MKIPYKFKYQGDDFAHQDVEFVFPTTWEDLTFEQGSRLFIEWLSADRENVFLLLSILTGVDIWIWERAMGDIELDIIPHLKEFANPPDLENLPFPETIIIEGETIELPKKIKLETFAQKWKLQGTINESLGKKHDLLLVCPMAVAVYAFPLFYKQPIDSKKLITFEKMVHQANFLNVYSAGRFFFLKSLKLSK